MLRTLTVLLLLLGSSGASAFTPDSALYIGLSLDNPPSQSILQGVQRVRMLSIEVMASCDADRSIDQMTFIYNGKGKANDLSRFAAAVQNINLTELTNIDPRNLTVTLKFTKSLQVQACKTVQIDIYANIASGSEIGHEHSLMIEFPSDIVSDANSVFSQFPLQSNFFTIRADFDHRICYREAVGWKTSVLRRQARGACRKGQFMVEKPVKRSAQSNYQHIPLCDERPLRPAIFELCHF